MHPAFVNEVKNVDYDTWWDFRHKDHYFFTLVLGHGLLEQGTGCGQDESMGGNWSISLANKLHNYMVKMEIRHQDYLHIWKRHLSNDPVPAILPWWPSCAIWSPSIWIPWEALVLSLCYLYRRTSWLYFYEFHNFLSSSVFLAKERALNLECLFNKQTAVQ